MNENLLPAEVAEIARNVSVEKKNEVQSVLNHVFKGVAKMREQLELVTVKDPADKVSMKMANTIRLGVRQDRLTAEKIFDAKREEVQQQMLSYKTEDQLWLKAKQTMQLLTKEIEENARWKEETAKRFDDEQRELKIQGRIVEVTRFGMIDRMEFENMSDETYAKFLAGLEKEHNDRIEAERKAEEAAEAARKAEAEERDRIRLENEKLRVAAEKAEAERKAAEAKMKAEREKAEAEKAKLQAEIRAKAEAEEKARAAEEKARKAAEAAPDKKKLIALAAQIENLQLPEVKGEDAQKIIADVKILLGKVSVFITSKL